jgi:DNA-directed RNA polymerase III subunit RPC2
MSGFADLEDESSVHELAKPVKSVEEKWKLLPHFLRMRGLMRQHIDSFDYFVNVEIKKIVNAQSNREIRSEADPKFFLRYTDIYVDRPSIEEEAFVTDNGASWLAILCVQSVCVLLGLLLMMFCVCWGEQ